MVGGPPGEKGNKGETVSLIHKKHSDRQKVFGAKFGTVVHFKYTYFLLIDKPIKTRTNKLHSFYFSINLTLLCSVNT